MTVAEFKAYFTEFTDTAEAQVLRAYDIAFATSSEAILGDQYDLAIKYLTAHFLALNTGQFLGKSAGTKSVSSKGVDGVSMSYSESGSSIESINGNLNSTSYGQMYVRLSFGAGAGGFVAC